VDFLDNWSLRDSWQVKPQWERFCNQDGIFDLDYLIDYARLDEQLPEVARSLGLPAPELPRINVSPTDFPRSAVPPEVAERLYAKYSQDLRHIQQSTGRLLRQPPQAASAAAE
jgi:hypothetical protein